MKELFRPISDKPVEKTGPRVEIPSLNFDTYAPIATLGENQKNILHQQWQRFWELRKQDVTLSVEETSRIGKNFLIHNVDLSRYASGNGEKKTVLESIFSSGILSGELGFAGKDTIPEDRETNFCADFFRNMQDRSIAEWTTYTKSGERIGAFIKRVVESYSAPRRSDGTPTNKDNDSISFVINPDHPELNDLLDYQSDSKTYTENPAGNPLTPFIKQFPIKTEQHVAVLVGIPANYIGIIIVGGKIEKDREKLDVIKSLVTKYHLSARIVNVLGDSL